MTTDADWRLGEADDPGLVSWKDDRLCAWLVLSFLSFLFWVSFDKSSPP